jgi:type III secretion apparatus protein, YscR/HrcR family
MAGIDPLMLIFVLAALGLLPFMLMMVTSYVKIVVVISLVRNALGVQQVPPSMVINGLAIIFTVFIMGPVAMNTYDAVMRHPTSGNPNIHEVMGLVETASPPLRKFLEANTDPKVTQVLMSTAKRIWPADRHQSITRDNPLIIIPAFTISELTKAFQIGFLLYLPFIAIDLIISNILLAMGMMMVSPMTISLPFKLLLFVTLDGWLKISQGLLLSYR